MTLTAGIRSGLRVGLRSGLDPGGGEPAPLADTDATSGIYVPSDAGQFTALGLDTPDALWLMQDASGNPADAISTITLTASGTVTYENVVAGWSRKFLGTTDATAGAFTSVSGSLPNPATTSIGILAYVHLATPAAIRSVIELFASANARVRINATPRIAGFLNPSTAVGTANPTGAVRPIYVQYNFTGSSFTIYTDQEKLTVAWAAQAGRAVAFGNAGAAATARYGYGFAYFGAKAQKSDAQVKTMLQALNWEIPWS